MSNGFSSHRSTLKQTENLRQTQDWTACWLRVMSRTEYVKQKDVLREEKFTFLWTNAYVRIRRYVIVQLPGSCREINFI